jgi:hypothetical protein
MSIRFDQLYYDCEPGRHVSYAAKITVQHEFGGFVFNGLIVARAEGDTIEILVERYLKASEERRRREGRSG